MIYLSLLVLTGLFWQVLIREQNISITSSVMTLTYFMRYIGQIHRSKIPALHIFKLKIQFKIGHGKHNMNQISHGNSTPYILSNDKQLSEKLNHNNNSKVILRYHQIHIYEDKISDKGACGKQVSPFLIVRRDKTITRANIYFSIIIKLFKCGISTHHCLSLSSYN